jgi:AcrR family transcriptional regulator
MPRTNPERRASLLDSAIDVLADEGARGLTFRAVDAAANVPTGTTSNYFRSRDDLLIQTGGRIYQRLQPDEATLTLARRGPGSRKRMAVLMQELVDRISAFPTGYLALMELRLESTRRAELRELLTERVRADVEANVRQHIESGLPGDATTVKLLYLAMNWMVVERLTLPGVFEEKEQADLIKAAVNRIVPA